MGYEPGEQLRAHLHVTKRLQYAEWRAWDLATAAQG